MTTQQHRIHLILQPVALNLQKNPLAKSPVVPQPPSHLTLYSFYRFWPQLCKIFLQTAAMNYYVILASLLVTMVITWAISAFSRRPLRGLWLFFLVVFLATWAGQLWITPFGPQY